MNSKPREAYLGRIRVWDVRHLFPDNEGLDPWGQEWTVKKYRPLSQVRWIVVHHDAAIMPPGDLDFSGSSLDEDLERLAIIWDVGLANLWGGFPYHLVVSPNARLFWCRNLDTYGAQIWGLNNISIGIALMGNFMQGMPVGKQLCTAANGYLAFWEKTGWLVEPKGHRELALPGHTTQCPGDTYQTWMPTILKLTQVIAKTLPAR